MNTAPTNNDRYDAVRCRVCGRPLTEHPARCVSVLGPHEVDRICAAFRAALAVALEGIEPAPVGPIWERRAAEAGADLGRRMLDDARESRREPEPTASPVALSPTLAYLHRRYIGDDPGRQALYKREQEAAQRTIEATARWSDRLVFDDDVSLDSPAVKGTLLTASHVVSLVVDGWTWADILRLHSELTENDICACLAYTFESDLGAIGDEVSVPPPPRVPAVGVIDDEVI